jgi:hypothetical protein
MNKLAPLVLVIGFALGRVTFDQLHVPILETCPARSLDICAGAQNYGKPPQQT